jgi:hypothetical protein
MGRMGRIGRKGINKEPRRKRRGIDPQGLTEFFDRINKINGIGWGRDVFFWTRMRLVVGPVRSREPSPCGIAFGDSILPVPYGQDSTGSGWRDFHAVIFIAFGE